jgi:8-oxo-dGTP diphosphatase
MPDIIHVAVAVIIDDRDQVCISFRHENLHQGGLWEFPGGKVEQGETIEAALVREIKEELNLDVRQSRPLITISHHYQEGNKSVVLHVRKVISYQGKATGVEGQKIKWVSIPELTEHDFPAANAAIIKALQLPDRYLITGKFSDNNDFISKLAEALKLGIKLVQIRLKDSDLNDSVQLQSLIENAVMLCRQSGVLIMLNIPPDLLDTLDFSVIDYDGFHVDSRTLYLLSTGDLQIALKGKLLSASCHNRDELNHAVELNADFAVLSPVQKTQSHPDTRAIGWDEFSAMTEGLPMPVYALGGVCEDDMETAWQHNGQGIAAISAFWK